MMLAMTDFCLAMGRLSPNIRMLGWGKGIADVLVSLLQFDKLLMWMRWLFNHDTHCFPYLQGIGFIP